MRSEAVAPESEIDGVPPVPEKVTEYQRSLPAGAATYPILEAEVPVATAPMASAEAHAVVVPSSMTPLQLSSTPLHVSVVGKRMIVSPGHAAAEPVQVSAGSHDVFDGVVDARQTVPAATNEFVGHAAAEPVHASATSHTPAEARQVVPAATKPSAGQAIDEPVQVSATSHTPAEARHDVPAGW